MSHSLNKKLRGKTIKIFGPPGTGKTENLLRRVQRFLKQGILPEEICYISFTNKAVNECVGRIRKKFKEQDGDAFKYFMGTEIDYLVIGNCFLDKYKQN